MEIHPSCVTETVDIYGAEHEEMLNDTLECHLEVIILNQDNLHNL